MNTILKPTKQQLKLSKPTKDGFINGCDLTYTQRQLVKHKYEFSPKHVFINVGNRWAAYPVDVLTIMLNNNGWILDDDGEPSKIIHLDGNMNNNALNNLQVIRNFDKQA